MSWDWQAPDYDAVRAQRLERLMRIRSTPGLLGSLKVHYAEHPADFISDWGVTSDPRNKNKGLPVEVPFLLFERQRQMIEFVLERQRAREPGIIEKSRDCGASWLIACLAATQCLFSVGVVFGFGSSKEDRVDRSGDPDSIFWKVRFFVAHVPPEFRGSWEESKHAAHMRISFPQTGSAIVGEAGDAIGRGGRTTTYFIDEAAHLERPQLIEASLASNTDCRVDVSTPAGRANSFAVKRWSGKVKVFTFRWDHDPRKTPAWLERQKQLLDPVTLNQEVLLSYDASVEGILIPAEWIHAAIDAHNKLGIQVSGERRAALDVADEGRDKCALAGRHGILLERLTSWSGKNGDIRRSTIKAINLCEEHGYGVLDFDSDGLGAGVRGDAIDINSKRREAGKSEILAEPFRGSAAVFDPEGSLVEGRLNKDFFANLKAQAWWALRLRFQATYRAVVEKMPVDPDSIIAIDPALPELTQLCAELVQPSYSVNAVGKIVVDKAPEGAPSPNLADSVMIAYASSLRSRAYFAAPTREPSSVQATSSSAMPTRMNSVFAVLAFVEDTAAVVYCAANHSRSQSAFFVLDYDLRELDSTAELWMRGVERRLADLYNISGPKGELYPPNLQIYTDGFEEGYAELLRQRSFPAVPVGDDLPPITERFNKARPYVNVGLVKFAPPAAERMVSFRGATRNHLRELAGRSEVTERNALAVAFATAVLIVFKGAPVLPPLMPKEPAPRRERPPWRGFRAL